MSEMKTLHEMCILFGVTRRAVQGYEAAGLVSATDKNKYGHLLYGEAEQRRVHRIKLYQRLGFTIREIKDLMDAPNHVVMNALRKQIERLKEEQKKADALIVEAEKLIRELIEMQIETEEEV